MIKNLLIARATAVKPVNGRTTDPRAKLQERRDRIMKVATEIEASLINGVPHTTMRQTSEGPKAVNTNGHYRVGNKLYVSLPVGTRKLLINGEPALEANDVAEACYLLRQLKEAVAAGEFDTEITAMFSISSSQRRRMSDAKLIAKVARAEAAGRPVKHLDKVKVDSLLHDPAHKAAYDAAFAAAKTGIEQARAA